MVDQIILQHTPSKLKSRRQAEKAAQIFNVSSWKCHVTKATRYIVQIGAGEPFEATMKYCYVNDDYTYSRIK